MDPELIVKLCVIGLVIYSTSLHELAHAFSANYFGDPTPGRHGRLTWNPLPHLSPVLTAVVFPIAAYLSGHGLFCLATTPVDPNRFRQPLRDDALVSLCGPLMNFLCAGVMIGVLWIPGVWRPQPNYTMLILMEAGMWNVIIGAFNLLPIPPLDGYSVIRGALPLELRRLTDPLRRMGMFSLLIALVVGNFLFGFIAGPLVGAYTSLLPRY